jgi:hypothetical protein
MAGAFKPADTPGQGRQNLFEGYPVASWQVGDSPLIRFPLTGELGEDLGNRIVRHPRAHRRGAKLDSTGQAEREFQLTALFNNTIRERGLEQNPRPLYPHMLRALMASFAIQQTGTLTLPTIGSVRCRLDRCKRVENVGERDQATLALSFVEDNEESLATASFALPSARATVAKAAAQTVFSIEREGGVVDEDVFELQQRATDLETLLLAPGRTIADLEAEARSMRWQLQRGRQTQRQLAEDLGIGGTEEPRGSEFHRLSIRLEDTLGKAADEKFASRPRIKTFVVDVEHTSLFEIAARFKQDAQDLLELNGERVPDPFYLEQGDVIRVFDTRGRAA